MRLFLSSLLSLVLYPTLALATAYDRPIPQAQSATAEFWFAIASIALILALAAVQWMIARR
ncbi:protein NnrT [Polycladidibacter stylochi]|uniref:protein NnrT n=1 Tax=Polycladidibacter stylochi TaxID=1807766 RepID=UPI00082E4E2E|nr:protein NnrT [Pseudovibrio stylochi]